MADKTKIHTVYKTQDGSYIGQVIPGKELGYHTTNKYSWLPCVTCGELRWVRLRKGEPRTLHCKYCGDHLRRGSNGRKITKKGYAIVFLYPEDFYFQMATKSGYVFEHRLVMAKHLHRNLHPWEFVHHKNGIKDDNRIENLELIMSERHNTLSIMQNRINHLEEMVTKLEAENTLLRRQLHEQVESTHSI